MTNPKVIKNNTTQTHHHNNHEKWQEIADEKWQETADEFGQCPNSSWHKARSR